MRDDKLVEAMEKVDLMAGRPLLKRAIYGEYASAALAALRAEVARAREIEALSIDDRYAARLAIMLECMLIDPHGHWDESAALLDEYKAEWERINPQPPLFMGEPMPPDRRARLTAAIEARVAAAPQPEEAQP